MATTENLISQLAVIKTAIRRAIIDKGLDFPATDPFSVYPMRIRAIPVREGNSGGGGRELSDSFEILYIEPYNFKVFESAAMPMFGFDKKETVTVMYTETYRIDVQEQKNRAYVLKDDVQITQR